MNCPTCGAVNAPNAKSCVSCGSPLIAQNPVAVTGAAAPYSPSLPAGTKLHNGQFTVGKILGQGGFGITYKGGDMALRRFVAIKEFFPQGCSRQAVTVQPTGGMTSGEYQNVKAKFLEEARTLARFNHPGIVRVFATFEENNTAYMVMEFVEGKTLQGLLDQKGTLKESDAVGYIEKVCEALEAVHAASLIHRDIKPDNILVTNEGRVVLIDFGTARQFASQKTVKQTAMLTPGYAPLEQYGSHARFGVYSDIYALGATLYHCLTGQLPPQATDRATGVDLQAPDKINPNITPQVSRAVVWAMGLKAADRPQTVREFLSALKTSNAPRTVTPAPSSTVTTAPQSSPQVLPSGSPPAPGSAAPGAVEAVWVQRVGDSQLMTNATSDVVLGALQQAFARSGVQNPSFADGLTVKGRTGTPLDSREHIGQVTPVPQGSMASITNRYAGQINDDGLSRAQTQKILGALEQILGSGQAASYPGWPGGASSSRAPIPLPSGGRYPGSMPGHVINDSGNPNAVLPMHLRRWNWGGFLLSFFWGLSNGQVGLALAMLLLCFIPILGPILLFCCAINFGSNGNELAWRGRRWESFEQFEETQKIWTNWGLGVTLAWVFLAAIGMASN